MLGGCDRDLNVRVNDVKGTLMGTRYVSRDYEYLQSILKSLETLALKYPIGHLYNVK